MSLTSTSSRVVATGDAVTVLFNYNKFLYDADHLQVYLDAVLQTTGYTVSGVPGTSTSVTFGVAPGPEVQVLFLRVVPLTQLSVYAVGGAFPAATTEKNFDLAMMALQQFDETLGRAITLPVESMLTAADIPDPADPLNYGLGLKIATDGSGLDTFSLSATPYTSPLTTKGDLAVYSTTADRLAVGANDTFLEADSAQAKGVKWTSFLAKLLGILTTKGDLMVSTGAAVARKAVGTTGRVLAADSNQTDGLQYVDVCSQTFRGLSLRSHPDSDSVTTKIQLTHADEIVTNDGWRCTPADLLVFDKAVTGSAGGMQAAAVASTWNKLYYIRKRSDGTEGLWGLRAKDYFLDASMTTATDAVQLMRLATSTATDKLAESVLVVTAGQVPFIDVQLQKNGSPTGNYWFTIEADSAGSPSGTPLATSDKYDVSRLTSTSTYVRLPFRTPATVTATTYWLVLQGDYTRSDSAAIGWRGTVANNYASGSAKQYNGTTWSAAGGSVADFNFKLYITRNDTAISLPSGYDQYAHIGWFYIDSGGLIKKFIQTDRTVTTWGGPGASGSWYLGATSATLALFDLSAFVPPIPLHGLLACGGNTASVRTTNFGHITATDMSTAGIVLAGTVGAYTAASGSGTLMVPFSPLLIEYQSVYGIAGGATENHVVGFIW